MLTESDNHTFPHPALCSQKETYEDDENVSHDEQAGGAAPAPAAPAPTSSTPAAPAPTPPPNGQVTAVWLAFLAFFRDQRDAVIQLLRDETLPYRADDEKPKAGVMVEVSWFWLVKSHTIVYGAIVFAVAYNANMLAILYALLLFCWGAICRDPFPTKTFFDTLTYLALVILVVKYAVRIGLNASPGAAFKQSTWGKEFGLISSQSCDTFDSEIQCSTQNKLIQMQ